MGKTLKKLLLVMILIALNNSIVFLAYSQINIDTISDRFQQTSKQLSDLEKYVYSIPKKSDDVLSSSQIKRIKALESAVKKLRSTMELELPILKDKLKKKNDLLDKIDVKVLTMKDLYYTKAEFDNKLNSLSNLVNEKTNLILNEIKNISSVENDNEDDVLSASR